MIDNCTVSYVVTVLLANFAFEITLTVEDHLMRLHVPIQHLIHDILCGFTFPITIVFRCDTFNSNEEVTGVSLFTDEIFVILLGDLGFFSFGKSWTILYLLENFLTLLTTVVSSVTSW